MNNLCVNYCWTIYSCTIIINLIGNVLSQETVTRPLKPPKILTDDSERVIRSEESLTLICYGDWPVKWNYPVYSDAVDIRKEVNGTYATKLEIQNASYVDTGNYECKYDVDDDSLESSSIYIYVKDDQHLFVPQDLQPILGIQHQNVTIPCRPTSPDVIVTLKKNYAEVVDNEVGYDPKVGITIKLRGLPDIGSYECHFSNNFNSDSFIIPVTMLSHRADAPQPYIIDESDAHVAGVTLKLVCIINYSSGSLIDIDWITPDSVTKTATDRLKIGKYKMSKHRTKLNFFNASKTLLLDRLKISDGGNYECVVRDHLNNTKRISIDIRVLDENTSYITLSSTSANKIKVFVGNDTQFIVKVDAYPQPVVYEWSHNGNEIGNDSHYSVLHSPKETVLKIKNININDDGMYVLRATNRKRTEKFNFTVVVLDKPLVKVDGPSYVLLGKQVRFNCTAAGNPLPEIRWFYKPCLLHEDCKYEQQETSTNIKHIKNLSASSLFTLSTNVSGVVKCEGINSEGIDVNYKETVISDVPDGFKVWSSNEDDVIAVGDSVLLSCASSKHNFSGNLQWYRIYPDHEESIASIGDFELHRYSTNYSERLDLKIKHIIKKYSGQYRCSDAMSADSINLDVRDTEQPVIVDTNMNQSQVIKKIGEPLYYYCKVDGIPRPTIHWRKNNAKWTPNPERIQIIDNDQTLNFKYTQMEDEGTYSCQVKNSVGSVTRSSQLVLKKEVKMLITPIIIGIVIFLIFVILIAVLILKLRQQKRRIAEFKSAGLYHFENGAIEDINPELTIDDQAELLPYDRKWEFPRDKLKLGKQLGEGAFGVVRKAEAIGIIRDEEVTPVAVKMVKRNADFTYIKALVSELKIMVHLGRHVNIANLLGACTNNVTKRELLVIVEYCRFGNLHNYLLRHRRSFIDQIDPRTGEINCSIGAEILANADFGDRKSASDLSTFKTSNVGGGLDYRAESELSRRSEVNTCNTEVTLVSMSPDGDDSILSNNSVQPEWRSNYRGDYRENVQPICTKDLLCWSFQVARGMDYLASRRVLHGDLAARNVLLAENNIVKICDFGLAKSVYKNDSYISDKNKLLPVKWMAIESIRDRIFSTQSDIWSFGIVLWEFFSLAQTPYPGMKADETFYTRLESGYRMSQPKFATKELYQVMMQCWQSIPKSRPSFSSLAENIGQMLEETVREHYVSLNSPYSKMNDGNDQNDYLAMMSPPDYDHFTSSNYYINELNPPKKSTASTSSNNANNTGYLFMRPTSSVTGMSPRSDLDNDSVFDFDMNKKPQNDDKHVPEMVPMLNMSGMKSDTESDSELSSPDYISSGVQTQSYFNPTYQTPLTIDNIKKSNNANKNDIIAIKDNYVNIPSTKINNFNEKQLKNNLSDNTDQHFYVNDISVN